MSRRGHGALNMTARTEEQRHAKCACLPTKRSDALTRGTPQEEKTLTSGAVQEMERLQKTTESPQVQRQVQWQGHSVFLIFTFAKFGLIDSPAEFRAP